MVVGQCAHLRWSDRMNRLLQTGQMKFFSPVWVLWETVRDYRNCGESLSQRVTSQGSKVWVNCIPGFLDTIFKSKASTFCVMEKKKIT